MDEKTIKTDKGNNMTPELVKTVNAALQDGLTVELEVNETGDIVASVITREEVS